MPAARYALRGVKGIHIISHANEMSVYRIEGSETYRVAARRHIAERTTMEGKTIKEHAVELTVELTELCDLIHAKSIYTNQLLRSCSSIGANAHEAKYAHSRADFISKMEIALKECYETEYWLEILYKVHSLSDEQYKSVSGQCGTIRRKLIASITTAKKNAGQQAKP